MALTTHTTRKNISDYVGGFTEVHGVEYCCAVVTVANATDVTIDPVGQPVISDDSGDFVFFDNTTVIADLTTDSGLPDGSAVGIVVGSSEGFGVSTEDVVVGSAGTELYVMFRGPASAKVDNLDWDVASTPAEAAQIALFTKQLEKQSIAAISTATSVSPTYVSA